MPRWYGVPQRPGARDSDKNKEKCGLFESSILSLRNLFDRVWMFLPTPSPSPGQLVGQNRVYSGSS